MIDWSRVRIVAMRELASRVHMTAYRVTLIIQLIAAVIAGLAPVGISYFFGDTQAAKIAIVDSAELGLYNRLSTEGFTSASGRHFDFVEVGSEDEARTQVADGDVVGAVVASGSESDGYAIDYLSRNEIANADAAQVVNLATMGVIAHQAEQAGLSPEQAQELVTPPSVTTVNVNGEAATESTSQGPMYAIAYLGVFLIYMAVILYGTWVAQGVVEEKASRIMEIMVNAARPRELLVGKVVGVLLAGLGQLLPLVVIGGTMFALQPRIADALNIDLTSAFNLDFGAVSLQAIGYLLVYFILGFLLFGAIYAGIASPVSRQEEVNQAVTPVMYLVIIGFFAGIMSLNMPDATFVKIMFLIPITAPFVGLSRILLGSPSAWEIALSIGLLAVTAVLAFLIAERIYRVGILMYGQRPGFRGLLRPGSLQRVSR